LSDVKHDYGHKKIRLIPFICDTLDDIPFLSEHVAYKWIEPGKLLTIDFSEADIPVAENYLKSLNRKKTEKANDTDPGVSDADVSGMLERMMSSKEADWLATSTAENPAIFRKLTEYSFSSDKKLAFHSSWILSKACEKNPDLISSVSHNIIESLKNIDNESVRRSFLKIITLTDLRKIDAKNQGLLADFCFSALNSGFASIAVKAYSMDIIYNLTTVYPELAAELEVSVRSLMEEESSAGIKARGRMILKKLRDRSESSKPQ
jgi:hypothetical protein